MTDAEAVFAPFRGLFYSGGLDVRTAPPYDVLDADEAAVFRAMDPYNVVHLDLPVDVGDAAAATAGGLAVPPDADEAVRAAHRRAAQQLEAWTAEGVLVADDTPAFYLYRQGYVDAAGRPGQTTGVVGALGIGAAQVLPHEQTTKKASSDRLVSLEETRTNLSMIIGLSLARDLGQLLEPEGPPRLAVTDEEGVHHRIWQITSPARIDAVAEVVGSAPVVIADGHHRYSVAAKYLEEAGPRAPAGAGRIMTFVLPLDPAFLVVRPIHRILSGLGVPQAEVAERLAAVAEVEALPARRIDAGAVPDRVVVVAGETAFRLEPRLRDEDRARLDAQPPCLAALPVVWVHSVLLPALGVHETVFHHSAATVLDRVREGKAAAAVLLPPVSVDDIDAVARAGERMPPKTTFFWPKARTGLVLRALEHG